MTLIDYYKQDLAEQSTTELKQYVRRYWYRAVGITIMDRTTLGVVVPRRGKSGPNTTYVLHYRPVWENIPLRELEELFALLKPYFDQEAHRQTDLYL